MTPFNYIEVNPEIQGGKPVIKGTRIPIEIIIIMLRDGASVDEIIKGYPRLTKEDIKAVYEYVLKLVNSQYIEEIPL